MRRIDVCTTVRTFSDNHALARDTVAFIHDLLEGELSDVDGADPRARTPRGPAVA